MSDFAVGTAAGLAQLIDHTLLRPDATSRDIDQLLSEARSCRFGHVCVAPCWVRRCADELQDTDVGVVTVVGFPLGTEQSAVKTYAAVQAVKAGAVELDVVLNRGALLDQRDRQVRAELQDIVRAVGDVPIKVILETAELAAAPIARACALAEEAGARFVKTSTGFGKGGASTEQVALLRQLVGDRLGVKAAGGIRDRKTALAMLEAGANRLGTSASVAILAEES